MEKRGLKKYADASKTILKEEQEMRWDVADVFDRAVKRIDILVRLWEKGMLTYREAVHEILRETNQAMNYKESEE